MASADRPEVQIPAGPGYGPYVAVAALCERVLVERDGTYSAIRIIDQVTRTVRGQNPSGHMDPFQFRTTMLIILKSGAARGRATLKVRTQLPSGLTAEESFSTIQFQGEDRGVAVPVNMNLALQYEGLYWFEVLVDDRILTKVPLRVNYRPTMASTRS